MRLPSGVCGVVVFVVVCDAWLVCGVSRARARRLLNGTCGVTAIPCSFLFLSPPTFPCIFFFLGAPVPRRVASEKLNFYTTEGGGYEIAFSLTKDANEPLSISAPQRWHKAGFGYPDYLMAYRDAQERDGDAPVDGDAAAGPVVVSPGEQAAVISSKNILSTTYGNRCEVLIDGLATFERYLVAMRAAQHSISILAWELSLSFGLALADEVRGWLLSRGLL